MVRARISNLLGKITILVIVGLCVNTALALDGSGTQEEPWRIEALEDFNDFAADANYWAGFTRLETDVNLAGMVYERAVIGDRYYDDGYIGTAFSGVFDGNDHKILNLTIDDGGAGNDNLGLFGNIESYGQVRNLGIEGGSVSGDRRVGGMVGAIEEYGIVSNCYSTGDVNGGGLVGGLIGYIYGSQVSNCYSTGDVSGTADHIGGLVGYATGLVTNCYSTCNVSGVYQVGGLMGGNDNSSISNCYSTGDVNGVEEVGGLMGLNGSFVSNCYSTGDVQGTGVENIGGLMGYNYGYVRDCFWDTETSGEPNMCGNEHSRCDNSYGKTTAQMHQQSTFTDWDFINVWNIGENQTYPHLRTYLPSDINKDRITNFLDFAVTANKWLEGDKTDE
ncbi:MAG: GLUG motif-containing protein [Planctomycetota bacterium]|jgi:hypothetical protein